MEVIPGPRALPILGNFLDMMPQDDVPQITQLENLADTYGPIYQFAIRGKRTIVCSSAEFVQEIVDERKFLKVPPPAVSGQKPAGLFAAESSDPDWGQAHRILNPSFGPIPIESMFEGMKDIAIQMVLRWARMGEQKAIDAPDNYTRLTLDAIALCTMNYRFNSFYQDQMHPYVVAMVNLLSKSGANASRPAIVNRFMSKEKTDTSVHIETMRVLGQQIIDERRQNPVPGNDMLNTLLYGKDPQTGVPMRDELIASQMSTFLVAGHETTSGWLSFTTVLLLQNPEAYRKAQQEVDEVCGQASITTDHVRTLKYIEMCMKEALRLYPTVPGLFKQVHPDRVYDFTTLGNGRYEVKPGDNVLCLLTKAMSDPNVFGEDAREFKPERMDENNPNYFDTERIWKPFGSGSRACLGRSFAIQEAKLVLAMLLQNFDLKLADPGYQLKIKQTGTIKPADLYIKASLREGIELSELGDKLHKGAAPGAAKAKQRPNVKAPDGVGFGNLTILYGSNTGTCQALATKLTSEAASSGIGAQSQPMDTYAGGKIQPGDNIVIITSSYEGEPPDNAIHFVNWLQHLEPEALKGVKYSVFGVGNRNWTSTYHKVPRYVDEALAAAGAERTAEIGLCDVSQENPIGVFEGWMDSNFWPSLGQELSGGQSGSQAAAAVNADVSTGERATTLRHDVQIATVKKTAMLTAVGEPPKHHIEIELPEDITYECGDYLAILPQNPEDNVRRIMAHFQLPMDATITLRSPSFAPLPIDVPLSVYDLLRNYVELAQPATKRDVSTCAEHCENDALRAQLKEMAGDDQAFESWVNSPRVSVFNLLTNNSGIKLPFPVFLSLLLPLSVRQYSISSSPLINPSICTLTYAIVDSATAKHQGQYVSNKDRPFHGVASTYLSTLSPNDKVQVSIRRTAKTTFRLPLDLSSTPMLMFCAGTGLAPFRGFLQQRAIQLKHNPNLRLAPAVLFIGCRSATRDRLYGPELDEWQKLGVVQLKYAFSEEPQNSDNCRYVSERMRLERDLLVDLFRKGARVYVCGSRSLARELKATTDEIVRQIVENRRASGANVDEAMVKKMRERLVERAAEDLFD